MNTTCVDTDSPTASAVTSDTPNRAATTTPSGTNLPIRRHGAIEVPAEGKWPLQTSSYVVRATKHGEREQLHIVDGWLDLDADLSQSWLHIQLDGRVLDLTAKDIAGDGYGRSAWHMTGVVDSVDRRDPATMALRYHGVYRRGGALFAWFSGTATIEGESVGRRSTRRPAERLHLDLLFESR